jgi:hypothetical protein
LNNNLFIFLAIQFEIQILQISQKKKLDVRNMTRESYIQNLLKTFQKFEVTRACSELLKAQDGPSHLLGDNSYSFMV